MSSTQKPSLLVSGASGNLGRRTVELLLEMDAGSIVAATRTPEKLADFNARGVDVRPADFDNPASLPGTFAGIDRLLLISTDAVGEPGRRITQHRNAIQAAEEAGVQHVIYTSLINPGPDSPVFLAPDHRNTEAALKESGLSWTVLRENLYTDLLLMGAARAVQTGKLQNAIGDGKAAYITREDVARASAAALADSFDGTRVLDITGPKAISQPDLAAIISEITGKEISYEPLAVETVVEGMVAAGLPRPAAEGYVTFDIAIAQDKFSEVSDAVEKLTGQKPTSVADFLAANRAALG